ncbi:MAG: tetratricopeptide repeat protein [Gammaproteobacteria bacterium]|nr:tetratricopeptide repeat protein [Gammaproteobacteria bacterium]
MKWIAKLVGIIVVFALLGAIVGGLATQRSYMLLAVGDTAIETSLWFAVAAIIVFFTVTGGGLLLSLKAFGAGKKIGSWRQGRRAKHAEMQAEEGHMRLTEGKWSEAEKLLLASVANGQPALTSLLGAARAANQQGKNDLRDNYLEQAVKAHPDALVPIGIERGAMQLVRGQCEQALESLSSVRSLAPEQAHVLSLLKQTYEQLNDWQGLRQLLPLLRQHQVLNVDEATSLEKTCLIALMGLAVQKKGSDEDSVPYTNDLVRLWEEASSELCANAGLLYAYANALAKLGEVDKAEKLLATEMPQVWSDQLVELYGQIRSAMPAAQLQNAEGWLASHTNNEVLLLALGQLASAAGELDKAKAYLEQSLDVRQSASVYAELGRLYSEAGDTEAGNNAFILGMGLS